MEHVIKRIVGPLLAAGLSLGVLAADITTSQTFSTGDTVTATKLNNIIANATIGRSFIDDKNALTSVESLDMLLIAAANETGLKRLSISNLFWTATDLTNALAKNGYLTNLINAAGFGYVSTNNPTNFWTTWMPTNAFYNWMPTNGFWNWVPAGGLANWITTNGFWTWAPTNGFWSWAPPPPGTTGSTTNRIPVWDETKQYWTNMTYTETPTFSKFTSSAVALTTNITINTAHSLAGTPQVVRWVLVCVTNTCSIAGVAQGDELDVDQVYLVPSSDPGDGAAAFIYGANATNVFIRGAAWNLPYFAPMAANSGAIQEIITSDWQLKCYAIYYP